MWSYVQHNEYGPIDTDNEHLLHQGIDLLSAPGADQPVWMAGGSGTEHTPYTKCPDLDAVANLAAWARWGADRPNYSGLFAVQWSGNMTDDWLADFVAAADYGWLPPAEVPVPETDLARFRAALARLHDAASPAADEVDPPAWDGIWLEGAAGARRSCRTCAAKAPRGGCAAWGGPGHRRRGVARPCCPGRGGPAPRAAGRPGPSAGGWSGPARRPGARPFPG